MDTVLKQLKNNKSRDPLGLANELFQINNTGEDVKISILKSMNEIKTTQKFPTVLNHCNITSLYKRKGARNDYNNYRGIYTDNF